MKYVYNKLVRDKIPECIDNMEGRKSNFRILDNNEFLKELDKKLFEEAHEFIEDHSVEELGDLMEVIFSIMTATNISMEDVEKARLYKKSVKGGFNDKIYLIEVEQNSVDEREEQELNNGEKIKTNKR